MKYLSFLLIFLVVQPACAIKAIPRTNAPKNAKVYFISPTDGATVKSPVLIQFGLSGMGVAPAGINKPETGHHHLLIDSKIKDYGFPIASDAQHIHFGLGQTEALIHLKPGHHTLQLVLGDHIHVPHNPPVISKPITIIVTK